MFSDNQERCGTLFALFGHYIFYGLRMYDLCSVITQYFFLSF